MKARGLSISLDKPLVFYQQASFYSQITFWCTIEVE